MRHGNPKPEWVRVGEDHHALNPAVSVWDVFRWPASSHRRRRGF